MKVGNIYIYIYCDTSGDGIELYDVNWMTIIINYVREKVDVGKILKG